MNRPARRLVVFVTLTVLVLAGLIFPPRARAQWNPPNPVKSFAPLKDGIEVHQSAGVLRIHVTASGILHVTYGAESEVAQHPSDGVVMQSEWPPAQFSIESNEKTVTLQTALLSVEIDRESGAMTYKNSEGRQLTTDSYRQLVPAEVNGEKTNRAEVFFAIYGSKEGLYGLGQHQAGVWNYRGETIDLSQENTNIAIPLLVSTNGYGIFWNNPSRIAGE